MANNLILFVVPANMEIDDTLQLANEEDVGDIDEVIKCNSKAGDLTNIDAISEPSQPSTSGINVTSKPSLISTDESGIMGEDEANSTDHIGLLAQPSISRIDVISKSSLTPSPPTPSRSI